MSQDRHQNSFGLEKPGIRNMWSDKGRYDLKADEFAKLFNENIRKMDTGGTLKTADIPVGNRLSPTYRGISGGIIDDQGF